MSAKTRITLFFALMMLLIEALVLTFIMIINGNVVTSNPERRLAAVMNRNIENVSVHNQTFEFGRIKYYSRGVFTELYDGNEAVVRGALPPEFTAREPLKDNALRRVDCGENAFYVYDKKVDLVVGSVWLRSVIDAEPTGSFMTVDREKTPPLMARDYKDPQVINDTEKPEEKEKAELAGEGSVK